MENGFISLDRKFTEWEWYQDGVTKDVFIHLLFKANWKDSKYKGVTIPRGSLVTSRRKLAKELNFTEQQIRTAIDHLKSTHEITINSTHRFSVVSIVKYDIYQDPNRHSNPPNNPQDNQQSTHDQPTIIRTKEQYNNIDIYNNARAHERKREVFAPPTLDDVKGYCQEKCYGIDAERFYDFYVSKGWMVGKNKMKDWKAAVRNWARTDKEKTTPKKDNFSNFHERDDMDWDAYELALLKKR